MATLLGTISMFLMYRVELKATSTRASISLSSVPNVPCGVERGEGHFLTLTGAFGVPNVPCGVESKFVIPY